MDLVRTRFVMETLLEGVDPKIPDEVVADVGAERIEREWPDELRRARRAAQPWLLGPGVVGLGVGFSEGGSARDPSDWVIKALVEKKLPLASLPKERAVPASITVFDIDVPIDVMEVGRMHQHAGSLKGGSSISHESGAAGTLGCLVRRLSGDGPFVLSCSHILALSGFAAVGDRIVQPAVYEYGDVDTDSIAEIASKTDDIRLIFSDNQWNNYADAAITRLIETNDSQNKPPPKNTIRVIGPPKPPPNPLDLKLGDEVQMFGASSKRVWGAITVPYATLASDYPSNAAGTTFKRVGFVDQVYTTKMSQPGDSGAVVLNALGQVVGLNWGGSDSYSVFHRIDRVFDGLNIELFT